MTTFAHIETGQALEPWPNDTEVDYLARFPGTATSGWQVAHVPDGTAHGAQSDGQGGWVNPAAPPPVVPQPNTHGNPYWPKKILDGSQFIGLAIGALGLVAANRLTNDPAFAALKLWLTTGGVKVDTDDAKGQFLGIVQYLTTTKGADGNVLMSPQEVAALMAAWDPP